VAESKRADLREIAEEIRLKREGDIRGLMQDGRVGLKTEILM
jgi:hypothetical protein